MTDDSRTSGGERGSNLPRGETQQAQGRGACERGFPTDSQSFPRECALSLLTTIKASFKAQSFKASLKGLATETQRDAFVAVFLCERGRFFPPSLSTLSVSKRHCTSGEGLSLSLPHSSPCLPTYLPEDGPPQKVGPRGETQSVHVGSTASATRLARS